MSNVLASMPGSKLQVEYPLGSNDRRCLLLRDFLDQTECAALLQQLEAQGFRSAETHYPPSYRNNLRQVFDDPALAKRLLSRMQMQLPELAHAEAGLWQLDAINPRWRGCRYHSGQRFNLHQDGVFHASDGRVSKRTFMLYLNGPESFADGDTVFYDGPTDRACPPQELARVQPSAGALIVFDHELWHAGAEVSAGSKTILRSDLLYRADRPIGDEHHQGYVFCLAALDGQRFLSGGRDGTVRVHAADRSCSVIARQTQSVLGLHAWGDRFAAVGRDRCLRIHDLKPASPSTCSVVHQGAALCLARSGETLYSGGADHTIAVCDLEGRLQARLHAHDGWVWDLCQVDTRQLLSVSEDGRLLHWHDHRVCDELRLGTPLRAVVRSATLTGGEHHMVVGDVEGALHRVQLRNGRLSLLNQVQAHQAQIRRLRALPDGSLLSIGEDGRILRWTAGLECSEPVAEREGFLTDALQLADGTLVSAGYLGGVQWHGLPQPQRDRH